jgi:hypothetical protein
MSSWNPIEIESDGKTYAGKYRVEGGIITVMYYGEGAGDKSANVGNAEPEPLARAMLLEVVTELRNNRANEPVAKPPQ